MNNAFLWLTSYAVHAVWQLPLLGAAGWCLSRWVKPSGPEMQHKVWVAVLILATLAPVVPIFRPHLAHEAPVSAVNIPGAPVPAPAAGRHLSLTGSQIVLPPIAIYLVSGLYVSALLFFTVRLGWFLRCTSVLVRNAGPASLEPDYVAMWNSAKERFFLRRVSLLSSHDVAGPVTAGIGRPVLLLPAAFVKGHSRTEFLAAVGHECAHIRRNDFRKNLFYESIGLLTSFHPVTWWIKSQIAQTREMVCDRMAAEGLLDRRTYRESLLQLASKMPAAAPAPAFHTMGMFDTQVLERRIMTLMTSLPKVSRIRHYLSGATAIVLLSICAGVIGSFTQPVAAQSSDSQAKKAGESKDLSCTYYDQKTMPHEGTCGFDQQDQTKYRCYLNDDLAKSQPQIGCEWKVKRALGERQGDKK